MEMSNNIHNMKINLPIVTSNFSPIRFRVPQLPAAVTCFPMGVHFKSFLYVLLHTFISTLVKKFLGNEFIHRFARSLIKFPHYKG